MGESERDIFTLVASLYSRRMNASVDVSITL